jgi:hypothetical protein
MERNEVKSKLSNPIKGMLINPVSTIKAKTRPHSGTGNGKWARQVTKGPISAGRNGKSFRAHLGPAGKRRRKS